MKIVINKPSTQEKMRELKSWCYHEFDKSLNDFHPEYLADPRTFKAVIRITCKTEEEALMFLLKWKN